MLRTGPRYTAAEVLPHADVMLLIDEVTAYGEDWIETAVTIRPDSLFAGPGGVAAWVGIEYMAQSIAAYAGIEQRQAGGLPKVGLLIGTRRYQAHAPEFSLGSKLQVHAKLILRDDKDLAVFDCRMSCAGELLAEAQIKAYRPDDIRSFLGMGST